MDLYFKDSKRGINTAPKTRQLTVFNKFKKKAEKKAHEYGGFWSTDYFDFEKQRIRIISYQRRNMVIAKMLEVKENDNILMEIIKEALVNKKVNSEEEIREHFDTDAEADVFLLNLKMESGCAITFEQFMKLSIQLGFSWGLKLSDLKDPEKVYSETISPALVADPTANDIPF